MRDTSSASTGGQPAARDSTGTDPIRAFPHVLMYLKAALAVWVLLAFLMIGYAMLRGGRRADGSVSQGPALAMLCAAAAAYGVGTAWFLGRPRKWIEAGTTDPDEVRVLRAVENAAALSRLPMPQVTLNRDTHELNACTYGLTRGTAKIEVTQALLNHLRPTDDELTAIMAHELGHVHHGDCMISTFLRFPVWLMDKVRGILHLLRTIAFGFLRVMTQVAGGWVGLIIVCVILAGILYLSLLIGLLSLAIFISMLALFAFEREREYLADTYAASLLGSPGPMQRALAKLEQAVNRVVEEQQKRVAAAGENENVDLQVAAPETAFDAGGFIAAAVRSRPSFVRGLQAGELLTDHPLTEHRVYHLWTPGERGRLAGRGYGLLCRAIGRGLPAGLADDTAAVAADARPHALAAGTLVGVLLAVPAACSEHWLVDVLVVAALLGSGAWLGHQANRRAWDGRTVTSATLIAAYVAATVVLILGTVFLNPFAVVFPFVFLACALAMALAAVGTAHLSRRCCGGPRVPSGAAVDAT